MRTLICAIVLAAAPFAFSQVPSANAANVSYLRCVINGSGACTSTLRGSTGLSYVSVAGYGTPGDGGGGQFQALSCNPSATGTIQGGLHTVKNVVTTAGIWVGEQVSSTDFDTNPTTVTGVSPSQDTVTVVAKGISTLNTTLTFTSIDNSGTVIKDSTTPTPQCFYRTDYRGDPHEWGAHGASGNSDDTAALQAWLNWTPGPWIASIPANYQVSSPLSCSLSTALPGTALPVSTTIQGYTNLAGGDNPLVRIFASSGFTGGPAVILAYDYCRLSGIAIDAQKVTDGVWVLGPRVAIDSFSSITGGKTYNVNCGSVQVDGLQIKNSFISSAGTTTAGANIYAPSGCANVRIIGDIISGAGSNGNGSEGIVFGGLDITVADSVIEQSDGIGLDLTGAQKVSVTGNFFDDNGKGAGGAAIQIKNTLTASICGNHLTGNGGENPTSSAQIYFDGSSDGIDFCGNVYASENQSDDATFKPSYVYDASSNAVLTNSHLYESPGPQVVGIYTAAARKILPQLQVPHVAQGFLSGLTLSNHNPPSTNVDIAPGEASDSTNTATIERTSSCNVDIGTSASGTYGAGGLDVPPAVANNTTYFYFLIAGANGANPNCIASTNQAPSFLNTGAPYQTVVTGTILSSSPTTIYNVNSLAGIVTGDAVTGTGIAAGTTVASTGTLTLSVTGSVSAGLTTVTVTSTGGTAGMGPGMAISAGGSLPKNDTIDHIISGTQLALTAAATDNASAFIVSGQNVITLSTTPTGSSGITLTVYTGIYRLLGALYTDPSDTNIVQFVEDGDTFYLNTPTADINTNNTGGNLCNSGTIGSTQVSCPLSVPCGLTVTCAAPGFKVEAFGRVVGGSTGSTNKVIISSLDSSPGIPGGFPGIPGYTTNNSTPNTAYPFHLFTDPNGQVRIRASTSGTSVFEDTDGWVWHRSE